jgi:transposase
MSKYHRAFKLEIAKRAQLESSRELSLKFKVSSRQVRYWSSVYRLNGLSSFLHSDLPYSRDFKLKVLTAMVSNEWSLTYTSAYYDLSSPGILFQWQKLYSLGGISRLTPQNKGKPRMNNNASEPKPSEQMTEKELREELDYLRAENAVLKKLEALAQAKKRKAKKRP